MRYLQACKDPGRKTTPLPATRANKCFECMSFHSRGARRQSGTSHTSGGFVLTERAVKGCKPKADRDWIVRRKIPLLLTNNLMTSRTV
jgi:hypothetical protein